ESLPADRSREDNGAARASPHAILRKQQRRQFPPPSNRARVGRTHRLEQRQELLARSVLVPFALAAYDLEQLVHGLFARALGVERLGQRKARLEVARVRSYLRAQGGEIARLRGALFQRELCLHGAESFVAFALGPDQLERLLRALDVAAAQIAACQAGH